MSLSLEAVGTSLFGGIAGAIGLSLLTLLAHWLWEPRLLSDGQYGMVFMLTIPCGGWLGLAAGLAMTCGDAGKNTSAGWICLIAGALVLAPALLFCFCPCSASAVSQNGSSGSGCPQSGRRQWCIEAFTSSVREQERNHVIPQETATESGSA